jgi:predicted transcriptional regulator
MSICTGRTPKAADLLGMLDEIEIAIPVVAFMEARHAFKAVKAAKLRFKQPFQNEIQDVGRDPNARAQEFVRMLAASDAALVEYLAESEQRLIEAIHQIATKARLVNPSAEVVDRRVHSFLSDSTDDMIAASIIEDALNLPADRMAFFSEDDGFGQPSLVDAMTKAGIYPLRGIDTCLAWCRE